MSCGNGAGDTAWQTRGEFQISESSLGPLGLSHLSLPRTPCSAQSGEEAIHECQCQHHLIAQHCECLYCESCSHLRLFALLSPTWLTECVHRAGGWEKTSPGPPLVTEVGLTAISALFPFPPSALLVLVLGKAPGQICFYLRPKVRMAELLL